MSAVQILSALGMTPAAAGDGGAMSGDDTVAFAVQLEAAVAALEETGDASAGPAAKVGAENEKTQPTTPAEETVFPAIPPWILPAEDPKTPGGLAGNGAKPMSDRTGGSPLVLPTEEPVTAEPAAPPSMPPSMKNEIAGPQVLPAEAESIVQEPLVLPAETGTVARTAAGAVADVLEDALAEVAPRPAPPAPPPSAAAPAATPLPRAERLRAATDVREASTTSAMPDTGLKPGEDVFSATGQTTEAAPATPAAATPPEAQAPELGTSARTSQETIEPLVSETPSSGAEAAGQKREALHVGLSHATIETTAQIAAQILKKLDGRTTRFDMALTPESLGQVDVSLEIDADGALTARLAFDNPAAAAELRGRADELRRQLEDAGFQLADDALQFAERDASDRRRGSDDARDRAFAQAGRLNAEAEEAAHVPPAARWISLSLTPERVDLKV